MELPNPDVEDVDAHLDVIPNLVVVDVIQLVEDQVNSVQDDVDEIFVVKLLEDRVDLRRGCCVSERVRYPSATSKE